MLGGGDTNPRQTTPFPQDPDFIGKGDAVTTGVAPGCSIYGGTPRNKSELVHFWTRHKDDEFVFRGKTVTGLELRGIVQDELRTAVTGKRAPYNMLFTENGIACTTVSFVSAVLGYKDPENLSLGDEEKIKRAHLLLAMFNAWQPRVFALSGWDLAGAFTLPSDNVSELIAEGDTRWINRGAYDLMGVGANSTHAPSGLPKAHNRYAPLPQQLADETSFARRLQRVLDVRRELGIDIARQVDIPEVATRSLLVMVHELSRGNAHQVTVLNFADEEIGGTVRSDYLEPGSMTDPGMGDEAYATVDNRHAFPVKLLPLEGVSLVV